MKNKLLMLAAVFLLLIGATLGYGLFFLVERPCAQVVPQDAREVARLDSLQSEIARRDETIKCLESELTPHNINGKFSAAMEFARSASLDRKLDTLLSVPF